MTYWFYKTALRMLYERAQPLFWSNRPLYFASGSSKPDSLEALRALPYVICKESHSKPYLECPTTGRKFDELLYLVQDKSGELAPLCLSCCLFESAAFPTSAPLDGSSISSSSSKAPTDPVTGAGIVMSILELFLISDKKAIDAFFQRLILYVHESIPAARAVAVATTTTAAAAAAPDSSSSSSSTTPPTTTEDRAVLLGRRRSKPNHPRDRSADLHPDGQPDASAWTYPFVRVSDSMKVSWVELKELRERRLQLGIGNEKDEDTPDEFGRTYFDVYVLEMVEEMHRLQEERELQQQQQQQQLAKMEEEETDDDNDNDDDGRRASKNKKRKKMPMMMMKGAVGMEMQLQTQKPRQQQNRKRNASTGSADASDATVSGVRGKNHQQRPGQTPAKANGTAGHARARIALKYKKSAPEAPARLPKVLPAQRRSWFRRKPMNIRSLDSVAMLHVEFSALNMYLRSGERRGFETIGVRSTAQHIPIHASMEDRLFTVPLMLSSSKIIEPSTMIANAPHMGTESNGISGVVNDDSQPSPYRRGKKLRRETRQLHPHPQQQQQQLQQQQQQQDEQQNLPVRELQVGMVMGVADGHSGSHCSQHLSEVIPAMLQADLREHEDDYVALVLSYCDRADFGSSSPSPPPSSDADVHAIESKIRERWTAKILELDRQYCASRRAFYSAAASETSAALAEAENRIRDEGSTLCCAVIVGSVLMVLNVGDSRCCLFSTKGTEFATAEQYLGVPRIYRHCSEAGAEFCMQSTGDVVSFHLPQDERELFSMREWGIQIPKRNSAYAEAAEALGLDIRKRLGVGSVIGDLLFKLDEQRPLIPNVPDVYFRSLLSFRNRSPLKNPDCEYPRGWELVLVVGSDGLFNFVPITVERHQSGAFRQENDNLRRYFFKEWMLHCLEHEEKEREVVVDTVVQRILDQREGLVHAKICDDLSLVVAHFVLLEDAYK